MAQTVLVKIEGRGTVKNGVPMYKFPASYELLEHAAKKAGVDNPFVFTRFSEPKYTWDHPDVLMGKVKEYQPKPKWFGLAAGLKSLDGTIGYLEKHPAAVNTFRVPHGRVRNVDDVLHDLRSIRGILAAVKDRKKKFRLDIKD